MNGVYSLPLHPIWKNAALLAIQEFNYGDTIPHEWIMTNLEIEEPSGPVTVEKHRKLAFDLLRKVDGFRDILLGEHKRYLVNIRGVGYKIIEPPRQTNAAMRRFEREVGRSLADAMAALEYINDTLLTLDDSRENAEAKAKLAWFRTMGVKQLQSPSQAA